MGIELGQRIAPQDHPMTLFLIFSSDLTIEMSCDFLIVMGFHLIDTRVFLLLCHFESTLIWGSIGGIN